MEVAIEPSCTSGVAPLGVVLDASGSTDSTVGEPFRELHYQWDFDDPGSGTWYIGGKSRNQATGPVAAHVFENPGTYSVVLTVKNLQGDSAIQSVTITVDDPDVVFSGENTVCFSQTGDFSGAPTGALLVTTSSYSEVLSHIATGKRLLLRRGETWNASAATIDARGPGVIGAFGAGENPDERGIYANNPILNDGSFKLASGIKTDSSEVNTNDWRITDLRFVGGAYVIESDGEIRDILLLRLRISDCTAPAVFLGGDILLWYNENRGQNHQTHRGVAVVDCDIFNTGGWTVWGDYRHFALMGSRLGPVPTSHVLRFEFFKAAVISNNYVTECGTQKHLMKLHGPGWAGDALFPPGTHAEKIVISNNYFDGESDDWAVCIGPRNGASDERLRDVIFERNFLDAGPGDQIMLVIWAQDVTVRNNIFDLSGALFHTGIFITQRGVEPAPEGVWILNNTGYSSDAGDFVFTSIGTAVSNTIVRNNLLSAPNASSPSVISGSGTNLQESHNLLTSNPGFISAGLGDFDLDITSPAIDTGATVSVFEDFAGRHRPMGDGWDLGAYEYCDTMGISETGCPNEKAFDILQICPNPFMQSAVIKYHVSEKGRVSLKIHDLTGRVVKTLVNEEKEAGKYDAIFGARGLPGGIYFVRLRVGGLRNTRKLVLVE
jgi:PKD repeat protein